MVVRKNDHSKEKEKSGMKIKRVGVDIGKNMFHACAVDRQGHVVWRKALKRHQFEITLQNY